MSHIESSNRKIHDTAISLINTISSILINITPTTYNFNGVTNPSHAQTKQQPEELWKFTSYIK